MDAVQSVIIKSRSGRRKFTDLVSLLASRGLPLGVNGRLYSAYVRVILYGYENLLKRRCVRTREECCNDV